MPNSGKPRAVAPSLRLRKNRNQREGKMATNPDLTAAIPNDGGARPEANVDKIRDILFGSQMREYDKRFTRLEERLTIQAEKLRDDLKKQIDSFETFMKSELDSLNQRLKSEKTERSDSIKDAARDSKELMKSLEKKLAQIEDVTAEAMGEMRKSILDQSKTLTNDIEQRHKQLAESFNRDVQTLTAEKTDRRALADLLTEVALRLKNEFNLPEG